MPKVIMRHAISGTRNGLKWPKPGQPAQVTEAELRALLRNGHAVLCEDTEDTAEGSDDSVEPDTGDTGDDDADAEGDTGEGDTEDDTGDDESLEDLTLLELREVAKAKGVSSAGKKAELVARIRGD